MPIRIIATSLALLAFTIAIVAGLLAHNTPLEILWRAIVSMIVCYLFGALIGTIALRAVDEHAEALRAEAGERAAAEHRMHEQDETFAAETETSGKKDSELDDIAMPGHGAPMAAIAGV